MRSMIHVAPPAATPFRIRDLGELSTRPAPRAQRACSALPFLAALDLLRRAWIRGFSVGLGAASEAQVIIGEPLIMLVDLRAALVAHAVEPRPARRDVIELAPRRRCLRRRELIGVSGHIVDTVIAHARRLGSRYNAVP